MSLCNIMSVFPPACNCRLCHCQTSFFLLTKFGNVPWSVCFIFVAVRLAADYGLTAREGRFVVKVFVTPFFFT